MFLTTYQTQKKPHMSSGFVCPHCWDDDGLSQVRTLGHFTKAVTYIYLFSKKFWFDAVIGANPTPTIICVPTWWRDISSTTPQSVFCFDSPSEQKLAPVDCRFLYVARNFFLSGWWNKHYPHTKINRRNKNLFLLCRNVRQLWCMLGAPVAWIECPPNQNEKRWEKDKTRKV